jgi:hypothetical protein
MQNQQSNDSDTEVYEPPSSVTALSTVAGKVVVLRTATVWMKTSSGYVKVRCLFDIGCQRTMIRPDVVQRCGLKSIGTEALEVIGVTGSDGFKNRKAYSLSLRSRGPDGSPIGDPVELYAVASDVLAPLPRIPRGDWLQEVEDLGLELADEVGEDSGPQELISSLAATCTTS